jgi:hypothetical protein
MKKSWIWILVVFAGSLPFASALQYYISGEAYRNTPSRNWLVVGQAVFGLAVMAFGLYKQIEASRQPVMDEAAETKIKLNDE